MQIIKQSTAITAKIGPFLDDSDGKTAETGLTIAQADVRLSKNGGNIAQKNDATSCTHDELGIYGCPLNTTDTDTLGRLQLWVHKPGALPVWHEYMVVTANVYDTLCSTDKFDVNTAELANIDFGATMKASINTEVDNALNTAIPGSPTANSINERVATIDDAYTATRGGYLDELAAANIPADLDAVLADSNELQTDWVNGGRLDLIIDAINTETGTHPTLAEIEASSVLALEATLTAIKGTGFNTATDSLVKIHDDHVTHLSAAPSTHNAAAVWAVGTRALTDKAGFSLSAAGIDSIIDEVVEGTLTLRQAVRIMVSALVNKSTGGGTATLTSRDIADSKARVTLTVDANGNRTASTLDGA